MSSHWGTIEEYLSSDFVSFSNRWIPQTYPWILYTTSIVFEKTIEKIISTYKKENIIHNLDINDLFVREYPPHDSINVLHSLVDIGEEIFKDARPRNELEEKIINDFVRSKAKILSSKKL